MQRFFIVFGDKPISGKPSLGRILLDGNATAIRARQLAEWLKLKPIAGLETSEDITGSTWRNRIGEPTGIAFFDGYWRQDSCAPDHPGDGHIDLCNGSRLVSNSVPGTLGTFARFTPNRRTEPPYSDLSQPKRILFGETK